MNDYRNFHGQANISPLKRHTQSMFRLHQKSTLEGFVVKIDKEHEKRVVIQRHSNPLNERLEDKQLTIIEEESQGLRWGSVIEGYESSKYMVLTPPFSSDGVILKCKIRKLTNKVAFSIGKENFIYDCISTQYLMYDDKTYTNDTKVFEEDDRRAIAIPYDENVAKLRLIDDVYVDGVGYRIIQIHNNTHEKEGVVSGVVQIVLLRTTFGDLVVNDKPLRGIVRFARMKDKVLNSKSRELITEHNQVKTGDYITHSYTRDSSGTLESRNYIVRSLVDMRNEYDITYLINCDSEFYLWDNKGKKREMIPCYVEDNRTRLEERERNEVRFDNSQYQIIIQSNELTRKLGRQVKRVIIKGEAYEIVGKDDLSLENAIYLGLTTSKIDPNKDNEELGIADYVDQIDKEEVQVVDEIFGSSEIIISCDNVYGLQGATFKSWSVDSDRVVLKQHEEVENVIVQAKDSYTSVGKQFELSCIVGSVTYKKTITIVSW